MAIKVSGTEVISDDKRILNNESLPDIRPSLLLDFANSKTLDPRITFTRGSTATYWDGKTTAKAEENLAKYSEDSTQSPWNSTNGFTTSNATTAPNGETTADKFTENTDTDFHNLTRGSGDPITVGTTYTISLYLKNNSGTRNIGFRGLGNGGVGEFPIFNIVSGTIVDSGTEWTNVSITDVGSGWYRCVATTTATSTFGLLFHHLNGSTQNYTGDGSSSTFFWGLQIEERSSATAYTATTSSPIVKYQPVLQTAASGEARFDHDPVTGESKGLLIEEARTNLVTHSEAFDDASWVKASAAVTITANQAVSPDGNTTADEVDLYHTSGFMYDVISVSAETAYTFSWYIKAGTATAHVYGFYDQSNATWITQTEYTITDGEDVGNGWYRISKTHSTPAGCTSLRVYPLRISDGIGPVSGAVGTSYVWGAQLEVGSFPTSYIPTSGSTVTRAKDDAYMTDLSMFAPNEFTVYVEAKQPPLDQYRRMVDVGDTSGASNTNTVCIFGSPSGNISAQLRANGVSQAAPTFVLSNSRGDTLKAALAVAEDNLAFSVDGQSVISDTNVKLAGINLSRVWIGQGTEGYSLRYADEPIFKIAIYPKRLPNATLQAMTEA